MPQEQLLYVESLSWKGRNLALEIKLLRLSDSGAKGAVGAFPTLAQTVIRKCSHPARRGRVDAEDCVNAEKKG